VTAGTPTESVNVSVTNNGYGGFGFAGAHGQSSTSSQASASVAALQAVTPNIKFNGSDVVGTTQNVVVGQQIVLSEDVPSPQNQNIASRSWNVTSGTAVGGYQASTSGGAVSALPTSNAPSYTLYWVYPGSSLTVTYNYTLTNGQTSPTVTATFNVTGPSSVIAYVCGGILPANGCTANGPLGAVGVEQAGTGAALEFGVGNVNGIIFTVSAASSPLGVFSFIQLINSVNTTYYQTGGITCPDNVGAGLDKSLPYGYAIPPSSSNNPPTTTDDSPGVPLFSDDTEVKTTLSATMYVMWTSTTATNPIQVPIGTVSWGYSGDAIQNLSTGVWSLNPNGTNAGNAGQFMQGPTYPQWSAFNAGGPPPCN